ncbi:MAG: phosphoesterase [Deltaproteobacteria bacterium]|nr:phosphoesterase [Deltaproteobacteria bacterium]
MPIPNSIKHIIVLMLENRSFDHMLGFYPGVNGLNGTESIPIDPDSPASGSINIIKTSDSDGYTTDPDPMHNLEDVSLQLYGSKNADFSNTPLNNGFFKNYLSRCGNNETKARNIMKCFSPEQLPVLITLAKNFVVCDNWFCSVPGPTWPNRFFAHAATSHGILDNRLARGPFRMKTIYNLIEEKNKELPLHQKISWRIYWENFPHTSLFIKLADYNETNLSHFNNFIGDVHLCGESDRFFPNYVFIEPGYEDAKIGKKNDQHPPGDLRKGEALIAYIYNILRGNENLWNSSLFVILYDEHGGFYDHVPPPGTVPPDDKRSPDHPSFNFDRLGLRVPALLISPYVAKGGVDKTLYDHTSILATVEERFGLPNLTERDKNANKLGNSFSNIPRTDCPVKIDVPAEFKNL